MLLFPNDMLVVFPTNGPRGAYAPSFHQFITKNSSRLYGFLSIALSAGLTWFALSPQKK